MKLESQGLPKIEEEIATSFPDFDHEEIQAFYNSFFLKPGIMSPKRIFREGDLVIIIGFFQLSLCLFKYIIHKVKMDLSKIVNLEFTKRSQHNLKFVSSNEK